MYVKVLKWYIFGNIHQSTVPNSHAQHFRWACTENFNTYIKRKNGKGNDPLIIKIFGVVSYYSYQYN